MLANIAQDLLKRILSQPAEKVGQKRGIGPLGNPVQQSDI